MADLNSNKKPILRITPEDVGNPQVNFDRKQFDDLIWDKGYLSNIERALKCPCLTVTSGQANPACKNCGGSGWFFIDKQQTRLVCTSLTNRNKYEVWTKENAGTVSISARPQDKLGFMDRITLLELQRWFTETLELKTSISEPGNMFTFVTYQPIEIYEIYLFISPSDPLQYLTKDTDYTVNDGLIKVTKSFIDSLDLNIEGNPTLTIRYTHNPTFHVLDVNRDLIKQPSKEDCKTGEKLETNYPLNFIARSAHYILDKSNYRGDSLFDNTNYNRPQINYDY